MEKHLKRATMKGSWSAGLDKQLDDLRSKWDTLFRQKVASSNAGGLSDEQRRRAQEELQRALGGF